MTTTWLPGARVHDLHPAIGNGPFGAPGRTLLGVVLHVNVDEHGTPHTFWGNGNRGQVCPNFQVFKDGSIDQMLPFNWQPWCQINGNFNYAAIETAGLPNEPLTSAQIASIAKILAVYHREHGVKLAVANAPGQKGLITHQAGGAAWGGHACPGTIRAGQRPAILAATSKLVTAKPPAKPGTKPVAKPVTKPPAHAAAPHYPDTHDSYAHGLASPERAYAAFVTDDGRLEIRHNGTHYRYL